MRSERGSAHILVLVLGMIPFLLLLFVVLWQQGQSSSLKTLTKLAIDRATHAASLYFDSNAWAMGEWVWDEAEGRKAFLDSLQKNLYLDASLQPLGSRSRLSAKPIIHELTFVTQDTYPMRWQRTYPVLDGDGQWIQRRIDVVLYGPAVVAVVEVRSRIATIDRSVLLTSVAGVRIDPRVALMAITP